MFQFREPVLSGNCGGWIHPSVAMMIIGTYNISSRSNHGNTIPLHCRCICKGVFPGKVRECDNDSALCRYDVSIDGLHSKWGLILWTFFGIPSILKVLSLPCPLWTLYMCLLRMRQSGRLSLLLWSWSFWYWGWSYLPGESSRHILEREYHMSPTLFNIWQTWERFWIEWRRFYIIFIF